MKITEVIGVGSTVEEAKENALKNLTEDYDEVDFEVIKQPEKKKFGLFGGSDAEVKAIAKKSRSKEAKAFLMNILSKFDITDMTLEEIKGETGVTFNISGENLGCAIGYRGETLDALQYLTGLVANKYNNAFYRVTINMGDYKQKKDKALIYLAKKTAYRVLETGRPSSFNPMNSYERRLIHTTVQEIPGVTSWSEGEKKERHVIIGIDDTEKDVPLYKKIN